MDNQQESYITIEITYWNLNNLMELNDFDMDLKKKSTAFKGCQNK